MAFFYLPVSALVTIVILNDGTIISVAFDNVASSQKPEEWSMSIVALISCVIGGVALLSSVLLLWWSLECSNNYYHTLNSTACPTTRANWISQSGYDWGMGTLHYHQVRTVLYLKIALSDYLSLFNSRCQSWFFSRSPSYHVCIAAIAATGASTLLAVYWPFGSNMEGITWGTAAFVWVYTLVWAIWQDIAKVVTYEILFATETCKRPCDINTQSYTERIANGRRMAADVFEQAMKDDVEVESFVTSKLEEFKEKARKDFERENAIKP